MDLALGQIFKCLGALSSFFGDFYFTRLFRIGF
jgi:hypothetical protein